MQILHKTLIFGLSVILSTIAVAGGLEFSYKTVDDSQIVSQYLDQTIVLDQGVLGVNSTTETAASCPDTKPIIGWIDFRGKKTIKSSLIPGQTPSSCFSNNKEANDNGFYSY